jgi:dihydroorotate dehydrogenase electron transfer subunit
MPNRKKIIQGEIIANMAITAEHFLMEIVAPWLAENAVPGQFVMVKIQENTTDPLLRIPLGIHSINKHGISLLYRVIGKGTKLLSTRTPGEKINLLGPLGNGFNTNVKQTQAVLVAGGYGVVPLYALAETLINKHKTVDIFIGAATKAQIICTKEFAKLGAKVHIATEDGSEGHKGLITELVQQNLPQNDSTIVYACGPTTMLKALANITQELKIPAQLSVEAYMACGIGVCRGCAVTTTEGYKMCCQDGPVFNAEILV